MRMNPDMDDDEKGKLFVGGLSWETSQENLQRYFSRYGDVIDCVVMKNSESGRSRGFGFVTFAEPSLVNVVLQNGPHQLDGRTIDPKPCNPRTLQKPKRGGGYPKVFLGGLPSNVTETDLRVFFGRYGKVMEVVIMYDQEKKKSRGFGFLSFEDEISVERVTQEHFINLNGKQVEIKRAEPRDGSGKLGTGGGGMGGGMGTPGDAPQAGQWGPPQAAPINMIQGHNGQMGGPPINMPMAGPNIMQGYQGWGTSPGQTSYAGYGAAGAGAGPGNYQGWGAPPAPQAPPHAPAWPATNNYTQHGQPPAQGYGSYANYSSAPAGASAGGSWTNWNMPQNSNSTGSGSYVPLSEGGEMYGRGGGGAGGGAAPALTGALSSAALSKSSSADYSTYQQYPPAYQQDQGSSYGGGGSRAYGAASEYHGSAPAAQPPGSCVLKRWTQLRDTWKKTLNENKEIKKSGSGAKSKLYKYDQELSFLKPIMKPGETHDNNPNSRDEIERQNDGEQDNNQNTRDEIQRQNDNEKENRKETRSESSSKKKRVDSGSEVDDKMLKLIDHQLNTIGSNDRNLNFFKCILPSLHFFDDDQILEFQSGVINLIQSIKTGRGQLNSPSILHHHNYNNEGYYTRPLPQQSPIAASNNQEYYTRPLPEQSPIAASNNQEYYIRPLPEQSPIAASNNQGYFTGPLPEQSSIANAAASTSSQPGTALSQLESTSRHDTTPSRPSVSSHSELSDDYEYTGGSGDGYQRSSKRSYHGTSSGGAASASYHPYRR